MNARKRCSCGGWYYETHAYCSYCGKKVDPNYSAETLERVWVTINEAAEIANCSRRTIYHWIEADRLNIRRTPSGLVRIDRRELLTKYSRNRNKPEVNLEKGT